MRKYPRIKEVGGKKTFFKFTLNQRIQHVILFTTLITLVLTGFPMKFHDSSWAPYIYSIFGGINGAPIVHRTAGTILLILFGYHLIYAAVTIVKYHLKPLKENGSLSIGTTLKTIFNLPIIPNLKDAKDIKDLLNTFCS